MSIQITPEAHRILYMAEYNARRFGVCKHHTELPDGRCCTTGHIFKAAGLDPQRVTFNPSARHSVVDETTGLAILAAGHATGQLNRFDEALFKGNPAYRVYPLSNTLYLAMHATGRLASWNDERERVATDVTNALHQAQRIEEISLWP